MGDTGNSIGLAGRTGEVDGIGLGGSGDLDFSRSALLTKAEDQMMGIGAVSGGGEVLACDFGGSEGLLDCEIGSGGEGRSAFVGVL